LAQFLGAVDRASRDAYLFVRSLCRSVIVGFTWIPNNYEPGGS
jgi:hypothetical protein